MSGLGEAAQGGGPSGLLLSSYRAVGQMMSTMFYPLVTFVLLVICISYWALIALYPLYGPPLERWCQAGPVCGVSELSCKSEQGLNASPVCVLCVSLCVDCSSPRGSYVGVACD